MHKSIFIGIKNVALILILVNQINYCTAKKFDTNEIATICKIWGFLKYHHPVVSKGKLDWDAELISILHSEESAEFNSEMIKWIKHAGVIRASYSIIVQDTNDNESLRWINTDALINDSLRNILWQVYCHRQHSSRYYVKPFFINGTVMFKHEKGYLDMSFSNSGLRVLAVARYWNAINYFYPYLKLMDDDWNNVLPKVIDKMRSVSTREEYINTLKWMVKSTNDGHNIFSVFYSFKRDSLMWTPYTFSVFQDKIKVDGYYTNSLSVSRILKEGDEIIEVDNQPTSEHVSLWKSYFNASNNDALLNWVSYFVLAGYDSVVHLKVQRNDSLFEINIDRFREETLISLQSKLQPLKDSVINDIPYLNLEYVSKKEIETFIKKNFNAKAMVIDLRNYPKADAKVVFAKYLLNERRKFADVKLMDVNNLGCTRRMKKDSSIWDWSWIGGSAKKIYKGKVVVLVNANTISHSEFTAMAMQVMPQVVVIGSKTGGANGNVTSLILPGNFTTYMSGIRISYPNGATTQRVGIKLDISVNEFSNSDLGVKDIIFQKAKEYIMKL